LLLPALVLLLPALALLLRGWGLVGVVWGLRAGRLALGCSGWGSSWGSGRVCLEPWLSWGRVYKPCASLSWVLCGVLVSRLCWLLGSRCALEVLLAGALLVVALRVALLALLHGCALWPLCWCPVVIPITLLLLWRAIGCIQGR